MCSCIPEDEQKRREEEARRKRNEDSNNAGEIGFVIDAGGDGISPTIGIGGGLGVDMTDGSITIGGIDIGG